MTHFALADAAGISAAFVLFAPLSFFPGYLIAHLLNLWQFRARTSAFQLAASVSLSLSVGPILIFLLGSIVSWRFVWLVYLAILIAILGRLKACPTRRQLDKNLSQAFLVGGLWSVFAGVWLMDWQFGTRVYFPIYAFDYGTRAQFVHSLAAFGLPAQSPVFDPGHPVALHYHFLWLLECALVHYVAPILIPARIALIAGAIWCGLGLMCVTALAMRLLFNGRSWIAIILLACTGIDLIPNLLHLLPTRMHLTGALHVAIWEPHYICSLVACITGFLLLWKSPGLKTAVLGGFCFATAVGSGSFIALVFAAFLALWMVFDRPRSRPIAMAGVWTLIFSLPYLLTLRAPAQNVGGPALFAWIASPFSPTQMPVILQLLTLPLHYLLEFGFVGICVLIGLNKKYRRLGTQAKPPAPPCGINILRSWWGRYSACLDFCHRRLARHERTLLLMAGTTIVICSFVESCATPNNDLGWRGFLVAQLALLLLAAAYFEHDRSSLLLKLLLFLGLIGNGYDMAVARVFPMLSDINPTSKPKWLGPDQKLGERTFANRDAYRWLRTHSPATVTIGQNPDEGTIDIFSSLYADRKIVAGDRTCTTGFGGLSSECAPIQALLAKLYAGETDYPTACRSLPAQFYVVKDTDPVWKQSKSFNWSQIPLFANQYVRIFACDRSNYTAK